jgi:hypothetical protein
VSSRRLAESQSPAASALYREVAVRPFFDEHAAALHTSRARRFAAQIFHARPTANLVTRNQTCPDTSAVAGTPHTV